MKINYVFPEKPTNSLLTFSINTIGGGENSFLKNFWNCNWRENLISERLKRRLQMWIRGEFVRVSFWMKAEISEKKEQTKERTFLLRFSSSPVTSSTTDNLIFGSVFTWHSYVPESFCVAYSILRFHSSGLGWFTVKRWSPENTKFSDVKMCKSFLRIQET